MPKLKLESITLRDFKNVRFGEITMPSFLKEKSYSADIVGIYGQNGSGKTAVIEAFEMLEVIMRGKEIPAAIKDYINVDAETAELEVEYAFLDGKGTIELFASYSVRIGIENEKAYLQKEEIDIRKKKSDGDGFERRRTLIGFSSKDMAIRPMENYRRLVKNNRELELDLMVAARLSARSNSSFLFSDDGAYPIISGLDGDGSALLESVVTALREYAENSLVVISSREFGVDSSFKLPITYQSRSDGGKRSRLMILDIGKPDILSMEDRDTLKRMIREMNTVLQTIVPHLTLGLYEAGEELTKEGKKGVRIELVSFKNGKAIPIRYESEGIIKIISIINILLSVYNDESVCLVIDEFDASIFEYLLGELIQVFSKGAKGQMIFTSHNLRILEMIDKNSIVFSTSNPDNRYIRMTNIRDTNNLRDVYIRSLLLGGRKENICEETDSYEIGRALRKAWRANEES